MNYNSLKNKGVLVTGGAGFIGSHIVEYLIKNTDVKLVRVIDNLSTGRKSNLDHLFYDKRLEFVYGDISNIEICRQILKDGKIDLITHQAAMGSVPRSIVNPYPYQLSNVNGTFNIFLAAKDMGIKRIVYASSSSVYGDDEHLPKVEHKTGKTKAPYASTKKICEEYAHIFTQCYNMEIIGFRYFNVFGTRQDPNGSYAAVIPKFITLLNNGISPTINGDGSFSRDFTNIDNVVQANIKGLTICQSEDKSVFGHAYNIGAGGRTTILNLYNLIKSHIPESKNIFPQFGQARDGDVPHSHANINLAKENLGYNPKVSLEEGMIHTVKFYLN